MTSLSVTNSDTLPADWRDFLALTKPRVMSLVVFTGLCGLLAAPQSIHPFSPLRLFSALRWVLALQARSTNGMKLTLMPA